MFLTFGLFRGVDVGLKKTGPLSVPASSKKTYNNRFFTQCYSVLATNNIPTDPRNIPQVANRQIWKDFLHTHLIEGLGYVPGVCSSFLRFKGQLRVVPLWEIPKKQTYISGYLWGHNPQEFLKNTINTMGTLREVHPIACPLNIYTGMHHHSIPIGSMYGIFTYIYHKSKPFM